MLLDIPSMIVPDQVLLIDGDDEITYGELRAAAGQVGGLLQSLGVEGGDRVGIFSTNRASVLEVVFGTAIAGATSVPMNYRAGIDEARYLLADSGAKVVFTEGRYRDLIESIRPDTLGSVIYLDDSADYDRARDEAEAHPYMEDVDDDGLATLLYTSGTTSMPKGVMLTHGAMTGYVMGTNDAADGSDDGRALLAAPLYHVAGLTAMLNALYAGRCTALMAQFEAGAWLDAVADKRITSAFLVPTMLAKVIDHEGFESADLSSLEGLTYGAAPMPPSVIRRAIAMFPDSVAFAGAYGQTETTSTVAVLDPDDHRLEGSDDEIESKLRRLRSVGKVLDDVQVRIVDDSGQILAPNEVGEVQLLTFRAMDGYWGSKEKTRVTIDDEGWVHTGDLGYVDEEDYLFLSGRSGDMIIRGGENIGPEEVEAVLYEHPDVLEAAVVGMPDEEWGETVAAAVVLRPNASVDEGGLGEHCRAHLAPFKRPSQLVLVDALPRTSTGKLLRREVPALLGA